MPCPILKGSAGCGCCQVTGTTIDFLHVPCQGYDPDAKAAFQPKAKQKGRSSTASLVKRKKKVMDQEHRVSKLGAGCEPAHPSQPPLTASAPFPLCSQDKVRQSLEQQQKKTQEMPKPPGARPSALDRFVR